MTPIVTKARLAILALILGAAAAFSGATVPAPAGDGRIDVTRLSRAVAREDDHVTAIELARWIKARKPGLRVIDLRSASDFDSLHIPTAERIAIDSLGAAHFSSGETIVLYSEGGAHAAQAWVFLNALGFTNVYFLRGGIYEWLQDVLSPTLAIDASEIEREQFARNAEISRYFGGVPRAGVPRSEMAATVRQIRRRGC